MTELSGAFQSARRRVVLEREFAADLEEVWGLWTTSEGIEAWWGPDGFTVKVVSLDLRPGGTLAYLMTATSPDQVEFMRKAGLPISTRVRLTFTEVVAPSRLAYTNLVDFIPGVEPYEEAISVEFAPASGGVRMVVRLEAMHDEHWTEMASQGWASQLGKLENLLRGNPAATD